MHLYLDLKTASLAVFVRFLASNYLSWPNQRRHVAFAQLSGFLVSFQVRPNVRDRVI